MRQTHIRHDLASIRAHRADFQAVIAYAQVRLEHRPATALQSVDLNSGFMLLQSAAWDTAQANQAFSSLRAIETTIEKLEDRMLADIDLALAAMKG